MTKNRETTIVVVTSILFLCIGALSSFCSPPQPVIVLPCKVVNCHDGDTLTCELKFRVNVRLVDCWAPELNELGGKEAQQRLNDIAFDREGTLEIPLSESGRLSDILTFGRVLGRVWIDGKDVGSTLVSEKLATKIKAKI